MLSNDIAIDLNNVSKLFYKQEQRTFKELLPALFAGKRTGKWFWALKDLNLKVRKGETIGIIGPNGSGKSTLLKLIAGVSKATKGIVVTQGRIAPLIELGAGFHYELTGRENVYLNGVILGMKHKEIDQKFKEIVEFAELGEFIDVPIKHYSSGMQAKLGFSVAAHIEPEILLVDETLAVGDEKFQEKCIEKFHEFRKKNITIIIVSHNRKLMQGIVDTMITLDHGSIKDVQKIR